MEMARLLDREAVAFSTPEVMRVFLACMTCGRVKPHYDLYAPPKVKGKPLCRCGGHTFRPRHISELSAAFRLLVIGWLWRKVTRKQEFWDPRMPIRTM